MPEPLDQEQPAIQKMRLVALLRSGEARRLREQAAISQDELAHLFDVDRTSIVRWEAGKASPRDARVVARWLTLLDALRGAMAGRLPRHGQIISRIDADSNLGTKQDQTPDSQASAERPHSLRQPTEGNRDPNR